MTSRITVQEITEVSIVEDRGLDRGSAQSGEGSETEVDRNVGGSEDLQGRDWSVRDFFSTPRLVVYTRLSFPIFQFPVDCHKLPRRLFPKTNAHTRDTFRSLQLDHGFRSVLI